MQSDTEQPHPPGIGRNQERWRLQSVQPPVGMQQPLDGCLCLLYTSGHLFSISIAVLVNILREEQRGAGNRS